MALIQGDGGEGFSCIATPVQSIETAGYITFGALVIPFVILSFLIYRKILLRKVLSEQDYVNEDMFKEFNGPITKTKLVLKGITFTSIATTIVVSTYTKYSGRPECENASEIISFWLNVAVWIIALCCYMCIWFWDIKRKYQRLQFDSKLQSLCQRVATIIVSQLLNISIATAFIIDSHIGNLVYIGNDSETNTDFESGVAEDGDTNCLCTVHGTMVFVIQIMWFVQAVSIFFVFSCKQNSCCKILWGLIIIIALFTQLLIRFILFVISLGDAIDTGAQYEFDWGDWLWFWLIFSMTITGMAMIVVLIKSKKKKNNDEPQNIEIASQTASPHGSPQQQPQPVVVMQPQPQHVQQQQVVVMQQQHQLQNVYPTGQQIVYVNPNGAVIGQAQSLPQQQQQMVTYLA